MNDVKRSLAPRIGRVATLAVAAATVFGAHACSSGSDSAGAGGYGGLGGSGGFGAADASLPSGGSGAVIPSAGGAPGAGGFTSSGGASSGGFTASGGAASGGTASGGAASGGTSSDGAASGGASNGAGGTASGGAASGGTTSGSDGGDAGGAASGGAGGAPPDCVPSGINLDPSSFPQCPMCMGQSARCLPNNLVMSIAPNELRQLAACDKDTVCVPDVFITSLGKYDPPTCSSISGGAGRCLSTCIGAVQSLGTFLPKATCGDGEKCAPCIDPRDGTDTGACSLQCDTGPKEPAPVFAKCCTDQSGLCVPPEILEPIQAKALAQDTCGTGAVCAPAKFADSTFHPKFCASVAGAEGRCLSSCVDLVKRNAELLPKDVCDTGELCAPCTDPRTGELTAACTLNGDAPTKPPVVFRTECCDGKGLCVPQTAVPARYTKLLPVEICGDADGGGAGYVCAPKLKLNDLSAPLPKCQATLFGIPVPAGDPNQFGACIPQCIADAQIAANPLYGAALAQSDCMDGWVCAPCVNPLDQTRTGACD
ncbi:MAG TPA: hypothetical protein VH062_21975 [Polyangiaceae bacterium]|jgi:hypothetical protein|nr:hypothetical protein [Polyangiaceae bacterium]